MSRGFYFHLIFTLGIMTLYIVIGYEFLLGILLLIYLVVVQQALLLARFDDCPALADRTGLPDSFGAADRGRLDRSPYR